MNGSLPIRLNWSRTIIRTCITTALHAEARPLIDYFKLKQDTTSHGVRIYRSENLSLTVGGVGKVRSAVAATCLLTRTPTHGRVTALNIGIAGCTQEEDVHSVKIGDLFLINKIIDQATGRESFPDILSDTGARENIVTTLDKPLNRLDGAIVADGLVDMESSGFYQATATFLAPHQIGCIKIVSDFLKVERFDSDWVGSLIDQHIPLIEKVIQGYSAISELSFDILNSDELTVLDLIRKSLRLTVTQHKLLTDYARSYKLDTEQTLPDLSDFTKTIVTDKYEGKQLLERIRKRLLAT